MASRVLGAFVVAGTTVLASLALATPASAHKYELKASCDEKTQKASLSVDLIWYGPEKKNTLEVFIDDVRQERKVTFGDSHKETGWETDGKTEHVYKVKIKAYDDPSGKQGWSKDVTLPKTKVCAKKPPKPEQPKPEQPKPEQPKPPVETTTTTTTTEAPSSSVTPPAPGGSAPEPPLAATGASPLWLLLSGLGLVGAGAGTLLFLRRRRSA